MNVKSRNASAGPFFAESETLRESVAFRSGFLLSSESQNECSCPLRRGQPRADVHSHSMRIMEDLPKRRL